MRLEVRQRRPSKARRDHLLSDTEDVSISIGLEHSLPPGWVDIVEAIQKDIAKMKENMRTLQQLHTDRLKVSFKDEREVERDRDIDILTQAITSQMKKSENSLKRIAIVGNTDGAVLPQEERQCRLNVMRALGLDIGNISKQFRQSQKDFMSRLRGQDDFGKSVFNEEHDTKQPLSIEEAMDRGFTPEQMRQMASMEESATERDKQIIHIAQSVNELAQLFKEINILVIEQGTILDRIDYNVEQTLVKVKDGTKELVKAEEISKKSRTMKCIGCLLLMIIILAIILAVKMQGKSK